ncbi:antibiotic biosynthesis monooxygenase [Candidatus Pantoea deserta]|uniref:Antibiotic biosynthesis monooxygenase n=1 Tax=Candidatus Pantoea deserta TaxID=1869313 RepID=A0A3N4NYZ8_9GAMM|nr:putative quinol monooxygenase [Pantoea deserta]RPE01275.1 antibiotic biosynthesis monooxygenase [Pantoea deserta]
MTVPVVAIFIAKPDCESKLDALFRGVIETTLKEEGCIRYQLNRDTQNPRRFVWTEEWQSKALLDKHSNAPHITELFTELLPLIDHSEVIVLEKLAGGQA